MGFRFRYLKLQMVSLQRVVSRTNTWYLQSMWGSFFDSPEMMSHHVKNPCKHMIQTKLKRKMEFQLCIIGEGHDWFVFLCPGMGTKILSPKLSIAIFKGTFKSLMYPLTVSTFIDSSWIILLLCVCIQFVYASNWLYHLFLGYCNWQCLISTAFQ